MWEGGVLITSSEGSHGGRYVHPYWNVVFKTAPREPSTTR